jgi:ABC-type nitrate/sulfonate/bicarbonate transport system permease component
MRSSVQTPPSDVMDTVGLRGIPPLDPKRRSARRRVIAGLAHPRWMSALAIGSYLGLWFAATDHGFNLIRPIKFPSPPAVVEAAVRIRGVLFDDVVATLVRVVTGYTLGVALGIGIGLAMSYNRRLFYLLNPLVEGIRPVPAIAMVPFFIMWFGLAERGKLLLTTFGVFAILVVSTVEAVKNVPRIYVNAARTLGASKTVLFRRVILRRVILDLVGPLRVALALSFTLVVAAEFMGSDHGLGYRLAIARTLFETDVIFLGVVLFGVMAAVCDFGLRSLLRYLTRWSGREVGHSYFS